WSWVWDGSVGSMSIAAGSTSISASGATGAIGSPALLVEGDQFGDDIFDLFAPLLGFVCTVDSFGNFGLVSDGSTYAAHLQAGALGSAANPDVAGQTTIIAGQIVSPNVDFVSAFTGTAPPIIVVTPTGAITTGIPWI